MLKSSIFAAATAAALFTLPMAANAITIDSGAAVESGVVAINANDVFEIEIFGDAGEGAGSAWWGFTAGEQLVTLETNSFNPNDGFTNPSVQWNTASDGSGAVLASCSGALACEAAELKVGFSSGVTYYLIASWDGVTRNSSNFDLRVEAVPLPAGVLLMGTALAGFGALRRRRKS